MDEHSAAQKATIVKLVNSPQLKLVLFNNIVWPIALGVYILFVALNPHAMLSWYMVETVLYSSIGLGFIALAEGIVLINGNFDLSVGNTAGLAAAIGAVAAANGHIPPGLTIVVPILVGLICGALNGILVGGIGMNAFLATLGTYIMYDGIKLVIQSTDIYKFPAAYMFPGGNVPFAIASYLVILIVFAIIMQRTKFGHHHRAVGSTPKAAAMLGISVPMSYFAAFTIAGAMAGLGGLYFTDYQASYDPLLASNTVFYAFAAAVFGGISLKGGRGSIANVFGGVILLSALDAGLTTLGISPYVRRILFGILVILAILVDVAKARLRVFLNAQFQ